MAIRYHINPETQRPNQCTAKNRCRFAVDGQEPPHFKNKNEAYEHLEEKLTSKHGSTQKVKKVKNNSQTNDNVDLESLRTKNNVKSWKDIAALGLDIEKDEKAIERHVVSSKHYDKAQQWIQQAFLLGSKTEDELKEAGLTGTPESYQFSRASQAYYESEIAKNNYSVNSSHHYHGDVQVLSQEIDKDKINNEQALGFLIMNTNKNKEVFERLKKQIQERTGYAEDPAYGIPTGEKVLDKWSGRKVSGYSTRPYKDVEVLKDAKKTCKSCGEMLVNNGTDRNANYQHSDSNGSDYCPANDFKTITIVNPSCSYCGTSSPAQVRDVQNSYSDDVECQRCGGVSGYAIGD